MRESMARFRLESGPIPLHHQVYLERLRTAGGEPLLLEQARLPADRFGDLLTVDVERNSLYDLLADRFGTRVVRAREAVEPVLIKTREARLLGVQGVAFSADDRPIEFARTYVRSDRTRYYLERTVMRSRWLRSLEPAVPVAVGDRRWERGGGPSGR